MSVLTASSSIPSVAFAADMFSDGSAAEYVAEDAAVFSEESTYAEEPAVFAEEPVEADTEDISLQADTQIAYQVDPESIVFHYNDSKRPEIAEEDKRPDFTVTYREVNVYDEADYVAKETKAETKETTEATCLKPATLVMTVVIDGQTFVSDQFTTAKALGHDYKEIKRQTITNPTHLEDGEAHVWYECARCGDAYDTYLVLEAQDHVWEDHVTFEADEDSNIKLDKDGKVVLGEDGLPVLVDDTMDGYYETVIYCVEHDGAEKNREEHVIYAKKGVYAVIVKQTGIATDLEGRTFYNPTVEIPLNEKDIELTNCSKEGSYVVRYYTKDDKEISEELIKVAPHHMEAPAVAEFATKDDQAQCTVKYDENGNLVVTNKSCYLPITYYEVIHCTAAGCPNKTCAANKETHTVGCTDQYKEVSRVEKVAEPAGKHVINTATKREIAQLVEAGVTFEELQELAKDAEKYVKVSNDTSTCEEDGTATVEYLCKVCKTVVDTETVKVIKKGHVRLAPVRENYVAPTCTSEGHYDAVAYCNRCKKVLDKRENVRIPRLPHTNETEVYQDENGKDVGVDDTVTDTNAAAEFVGNLVIDYQSELQAAAGKADSADVYEDVRSWIGSAYGKEYTVTADAYTLCTECEGHKVVLDKAPVITVDSVEKQSKECKPGSITLTATYTKADGTKVSVTDTFDYYSTIEEYRGRKTHTPGNVVKENIVEATATENGSYDEVTYCTVCGTEISRKHVIVNATGEVVLPAVTGLTAKATGMNRVALSWDAVEGAEGYFVIGFGENRTGSQIAYTTRTSWTDTAADSDAFNFYWVQPFNRNAAGKIVKGELGGYKYALGRVVAATGKVFATATEDGIELSWAAVNGANSYVVMSKTGSADAAFNASVATDTNTFVDTNAEAGEVTYYWVYATYKNADGKVLAAGKTSPFAWAIAK